MRKIKMVGLVMLIVMGVSFAALGVTHLNRATPPSSPAGLSYTQRQESQSEERSGLKWYVKQAKEQGKREIFVPAARHRLAVARSLDEALSNSTVVIAELVEDKSLMVDPYQIGTWYKFRVVEFLNRENLPDCAACHPPQEVPHELLPLEGNEILTLWLTGTVVIDDVKVTSLDSSFPRFRKSQQYLLFLDLNPSNRVARLRMGAYGVFTVNPGGVIRHINNKSHPFKADLEALAINGSALSQLRAKAKTP